MLKKYIYGAVAVLLLLLPPCKAFVLQAQAQQAFVHPGIPFTTDDLNQLKANIAAGKEPWASQYTSFAASSYSSLNYGMQGPYATVGRAADVHLTQWQNDMRAVFHLSLMWVFTNNTAYAAKATAILDAWATTNNKWTGDETFLAIGDYSEYFVTGADILKSTYPGWTSDNTSHVNAYFTNVIWPEVDVPNPVRPMNQGAIQLKAALSIAAFLDDQVKWNQAIHSYRTDIGGGLANSLPNGQVGDAGRDEGHWRGQVQALSWGAEVAWKQGVDLFSEMDNRLLKICELYGRYHLSTSNLTYTPFGGPYAYYSAWADDGSPKQLFNAFNIISNAYTNRKALASPFTDRFADLKGNDIYTFLFLKALDNSTAASPAAIVYPTIGAVQSLAPTDIGNVGLAGSTTYSNGVWTLKGAGALPTPPRTAVDAFQFAFQKSAGNAIMVAKVNTIENTGDSVRVGIMIRESLSANAKYAGIFMPAGGGTIATWRGASAWSKTGTSWNTAATKGMQTNGGAAPHWLKLVRMGSRVALLHSNDSTNWSGVAEAEIALPDTAYIGLVVASNNTSKRNTSTFSNVSITSASPSGSPGIISNLEALGNVGSAFGYTVSGTNAPVSYSAFGLPSGLSIHSVTGAIYGAPTVFGTSYATIKASNAVGTGWATLKIVVANNVAPAAPAGLVAAPFNIYNVQLTWPATPNTTSYSIQRAALAGGPYTTIATGISATSFIDASALPQANYYVIQSYSGSLGSLPSAEVLITLLPAVPAQPLVTGGNNKNDISWALAEGATAYNVKRSTTKGGPYTTIASGLTVTGFSDEGLNNGQVYYYVLSSESSAGESQNSTEGAGVPGSSGATWAAHPVSAQWNLGSNWNEGNAPADFAKLQFGVSDSTALLNDFGQLKVSSITFNAGAPAFNIKGNSLALGTEITNNSSVTQVVHNSLTLVDVLDVNANTASVQFLGVITGTGGINVNNTKGSTTLANLNTYSGGTTVNGNWTGVWGDPDYSLVISGTGTGAIGAPVSGSLGVGPVYLNGACFKNSNYTKLYNDIYVVDGTSNWVINNPGGIEFAGRLLGNGNLSLECSSGYPYYTFSGDNRLFTGKFTTIKRTSYFRMAFTSTAAGSALARWEFNPNFNAECFRLTFNGVIEFGEFAGEGSLRGSVGTNPILSIGALNTDATYSGVASDYASFIKVGTGTQRFTGANTYYGPTTIQSGKFYVNNDFASPVIVNGGVFGGGGVSSATVTVNNGGTLAPGDEGIGNFTTSNSLTFASGAVFAIEINSATATADKMTAGNASLNNAVLSLADINPGSLPLGTNFTIINNTGLAAVSGTFNGLPEYAQVTVGGYTYQITYKGGTGNDVVLLDERTVPTYITSALADTLVQGQSFTYTLTSNRALVSAAATGLPPGLSFDGNAGIISGTPTVDGIYTVQLLAATANGTVTGSLRLTINTNVAPLAPTGLAADNGVLGKASLKWNKLPATELVTVYTLKRSTVDGGPYTTIAGIFDTTYTNTGLSNNTTYYYVVSATNAVGESANSEQLTLTTQAAPLPSPVTSLVAVAGNAKASLRWGTSKYADNFDVKRGLVAGGPYTVVGSAITDSSYIDNALTNGNAYYYVVSAKNATGSAGNSNEAMASPEATANLWWPFNEGSGTVITDVWSAKTATITGGTWTTPGISGKAVNLNGTSTNYVTLPTGVVNSLTSFTISFWVKPNAITTWARAFDIGTGTTNYMFFALSAGSTPRYAIRTPSVTERVINSSTALTAGKWSHVAITQSGSTATMYINGVSVGSNTSMTLSPASLGTTTSNFIGKSQFSADPYMNASVDDFRIYGRSLSGTEIATLVNTEVLKAPANLTVTGAYKNVSVSWTASSNATSYNVKRSTVSGGPYTAIATSITATNFVDTTALMSAYYYVVSGVAGGNESFVSNEAAVSITGIPGMPAVPGSVNAIAGNGRVNLVWASATGAAAYSIKRSAVAGGPYTVLGSTTALAYTDNSVTNGNTYYYVVSAKNVTGQSANSTEKSATPFGNAWGYWPLDENAGTTTTDYWGGRTGTLNGGSGISWTSGISGSAVLFNSSGYTPYISVPSGVVNSLTGFTISAWVKPSTLATWARVFDFGTGTSNYMFLSISNGTVPRYAIRTAAIAENAINSSVALQVGKWAHIAITQLDSTAIMYINGVEVGRNSKMALNPKSLGNTTLNYFGRSQWSADPYLNGALDDIRIYNRTLAAAEIVDMVKGFAPAPPTTLTVTGGFKNARLTWKPSAQATSYNVKRATLSGGPYTYLATNVTDTVYTDATPTYGTYYYAVTSSANNAEGVGSNEAVLNLPPAALSSQRATGWNNRTDLSWAPSAGAASYNIKRSMVSGGTYSLLNNVTFTGYTDTTAVNGTAYFYVIEAIGSGGATTGVEMSATPVNTSATNTWKHIDVGNVSITGNAQATDSSLTLYASGADMYFTADMFHFAYQRIAGNAGIVARIASQENTRSYARAGIMLRDTITTASVHAGLTNTPTQVKEFIYRTTTGINAAENIVDNAQAANWLRLVRNDSVVTAAYSNDGVNWTTQNAKTVKMRANAYIGLINSASNNAALNTSVFDNVYTSTELPAITSVLTVSGTFGTSLSYNTTATNSPYAYTVSGLPLGLAFNSKTGVLSGVPQQAGAFNLQLSAVNAMGSGTGQLLLDIAKANQTITFGSIAPHLVGGGGFSPGATASSGLQVAYTSSDTSVAQITNNEVHIIGAGTTTITAMQVGNENYNAAVAVPQVLVVDKQNQTISFGALPTKRKNDPGFMLTATATSGLAISYTSSNTAVASISGETVHILSVGTTTITAMQLGNYMYNAAPSVAQTLVVSNVTSIPGHVQELVECLLWPNPVGDKLHILLRKGWNGYTTCTVYNSNGVIVRHLGLDKVQEKLDLSNLAPGLYVVQITNGYSTLSWKITKE